MDSGGKNKGYIGLYRKFQNHKFWEEKRVFSKAEAWIDILWEAQYKKEPQQILLGMKLLTCNYGECLKSKSTWAKRWGWSRPKVDRFIILLEKMNQIRAENVQVTTRLCVLNYGEYDIRNNKSVQGACRERAGSVQEACTDNKDKKDKKDKKEESPSFKKNEGQDNEDFYLTKNKKKLFGERLKTFLQFWDAFDYKSGKAEAADAWLNIPVLTNDIVKKIIVAATREAKNRSILLSNGNTPKMGQGWLSGRRWEDEADPLQNFLEVKKQTERSKLDFRGMQ